MGFLEHLQSSLILGTTLDHPLNKNFDTQRIDAFFDAVQRNDHEGLRKQIESGFHVDTAHYQTHETPLVTAITMQFESLAIELLNYGACAFTPDKRGKSPLFLALKHDLKSLSELLINLDAFAHLSGKEKSECVAIIAKKRALSPLKSYEFFLPKVAFLESPFIAAKKGELQQLIRLFNAGASLHATNNKRQSLLHLAIINGSVPMVSYLLNRGIDIDGKDKFGNFPLLYASLFTKRIPVLKLLVRHGATLDQFNHNEHTALTTAIRKQNIEAIRVLIEAGANINQRDGIHTPLTLLHDQIHSCEKPETKKELQELMTYFMVHGAHVNGIGDKIGWSALQLTVNYYDSPFYTKHLQKLLELGADVNYKDIVDRTALMLASGLGRVRSVKILIEHGAHLDYEDRYGWSALMLAVYNNQIEIVRILLDSGADINFTSTKQLNALKIAIDQKNGMMEEFLKDNGAVLK